MRNIDVPSSASFLSLSTVYRIRISIYMRMRCGRYCQRREYGTAAANAVGTACRINNNKLHSEPFNSNEQVSNVVFINQPYSKAQFLFYE